MGLVKTVRPRRRNGFLAAGRQINPMRTLAPGRALSNLRSMSRLPLLFLTAILGIAALAAEPGPAAAPAAAEPAARKQVVVIPVQEQIGKPVLYILRRGLKEAIEQKADVVVLDMKTPGGEAGTTIAIMEALERFPGETITFVNTEAGSAGAIIAMTTDQIYFAPTGVMGAAELILGTGADAPEALKRKMTSYIAAKTEALSASPSPRRADVLKAMMNADFELKIGDEIISPKGELLTVTAAKATALYGEPPQPLLAAGIAKSVDDLLTQKFGAGGYEVKQLEITWSEQLAVWLNTITPLLLGLGLLALFIEFKTPGFGVFGITGLVLLGVVFLGNFVAGFSGHEPILIFGLGVLLVLLELFFFPGIVVVALTGVLLMLGSLLWSMADIWPNEPIEFSGDLLLRPVQNLLLGLVVAVGLFALLARFLPKGWFWTRLAVGGAVAGNALAPGVEQVRAALTGREGVAATDLFPGGQVEIDGRRHEARLQLGSAKAGTPVRVVRHTEFELVVEVIPQ
jgi:membrane-bound serine protease (ClpP class)